MSDTGIIVIVVGVVAIVLLVLFRQRLTRFTLDVRKGRVGADMKRDESLPPGGVRQRDVEAKRNVTARDETGVGVSQEKVKAGGDVSAVATGARGSDGRRGE